MKIVNWKLEESLKKQKLFQESLQRILIFEPHSVELQKLFSTQLQLNYNREFTGNPKDSSCDEKMHFFGWSTKVKRKKKNKKLFYDFFKTEVFLVKSRVDLLHP